MSSTHTPLPWKVEDNLPGSEGNVWIYAPNAADVWHRTVASVGDMEDIDGEDLANAAFIVRACNSHDDLVAACTRAYEICHEELTRMAVLHEPTDGPKGEYWRTQREYFRSMLAKATEVQP